jgi:hypothetical protein
MVERSATTMTDNPWATRQVLELDTSMATVYVEKPGRTPRQGGRWLVTDTEVVWELPDGAGYRLSIYSPSSFPSEDFMLVE